MALGFFKDQDDIKNSPKQTFQSTVRPGDIKYKDINGDGVVDEYDKVAIGDPRTPEIMFGFGGTVAYKNFDVSLFSRVLPRQVSFWKEQLFIHS